jgi:hypothetical protein
MKYTVRLRKESLVLLAPLLLHCASTPVSVTPTPRAPAPAGVTAPRTVSATMQQLTDKAQRLKALVLVPDAWSRANRTARVRVIEDLIALAGGLRDSFSPLIHPMIQHGLDGFLADLQTARHEAEKPADLTAATRVASACTSCHVLGIPSASR